MTQPNSWWQRKPRDFLADTLAFINYSSSRDDAVDRCGDLCKALNKTWNEYYTYHREKGSPTERQQKTRSDTQCFRQLLLCGFNPTQASAFCLSQSMLALAELTPHIMNHNTLLQNGYDPFEISDALRREASKEHRQFVNAYDQYRAVSTDGDKRKALLTKTAQILYVVRSNIMHSEKTPRGPDIEKAQRDRVVAKVVSCVVEDLFEILFDHPSHRLAVYGTLAPGNPNASVLASIDGEWREGNVFGEMCERDGLPVFKWNTQGNETSVRVLVAPDLKAHIERLDRFEGQRYHRILVPIELDGQISVCNIYEGSS